MRSHLVKYYLIVLLMLSFASCDETSVIPSSNFYNPNPIDLLNPEAGQKSYFQGYQEECGKDNFKFTQDTLILEIIQEGEQLKFRESYTPGSPTGHVIDFAPPEYDVTFENDYMLIPDRFNSMLFFFYANDTIHLQPTSRVQLVQDNCKIRLGDEIFVGNEIGIINIFQIGSIIEIDKTAVSCEPFFELDAYLIYDEEEIRMSHVIWQNGNTTGWRILDNVLPPD